MKFLLHLIYTEFENINLVPSGTIAHTVSEQLSVSCFPKHTNVLIHLCALHPHSSYPQQKANLNTEKTNSRSLSHTEVISN